MDHDSPDDDRLPIAPSDDEQAALDALNQMVRTSGGVGARLVSMDGESFPIPTSVLRVLRHAIEPLARGRLVTVGHLGRDLSLAQVAEFVQLPYARVARLLDDGILPSSTSNGLQTVRYEDALVLKRQRDVERREALQWLTDQGQEIEALVGEFPDIDKAPMELLPDLVQRG